MNTLYIHLSTGACTPPSLIEGVYALFMAIGGEEAMKAITPEERDRLIWTLGRSALQPFPEGTPEENRAEARIRFQMLTDALDLIHAKFKADEFAPDAVYSQLWGELQAARVPFGRVFLEHDGRLAPDFDLAAVLEEARRLVGEDVDG